MITADTSALVSVVLGEPDAESFLAILSSNPVQISAVNLVEASIVVEARQGPDATRDLELLVAELAADTVACDAVHARVATAAWRRFGKGRHPAGLNFGDCFSYALATMTATPLLFKGDDFGQTDIRSASA